MTQATEFQCDGYMVRMSWLHGVVQFEILGAELPVYHSTSAVREALDQLIKGNVMQQQTATPAPDPLKARAEFLATHLAAVALVKAIDQRRQAECI